jgi:hypothetical protein
MYLTSILVSEVVAILEHKNINFREDHILNISTKLGFKWLSSFGEADQKVKSLQTKTTTDA